jgi:hypothetical protein
MKQIHIEKLSSWEAVIVQLGELDELLPRHGLTQFAVFNKAYLRVTQNIQSAANHDYFENPHFIERFTINFAHYYFRAINETIASDRKLSFAWCKLNLSAERTSAPEFIKLLMGANAHINHDLPLALLDVMTDEQTNDLLKDILKIDKLLMRSGREIIGLFDEPNRWLDFAKRRFILLYYRPTMYMILWWRARAWKNYLAIKSAGLEKSNYEQSSVIIAYKLLKLARLLGGKKAPVMH